MTDMTKNTYGLFVKHEKKAKDIYQKISSNSKLIAWLSVPCMVYLVLSIIVIEFGECFTYDIFTVLLPFIFYVMLLLSISLIYSKVSNSIKKDIANELEIDNANLSDIYTVFLAITSVYFSLLAMVELFAVPRGMVATEKQEWISAKMAIISLTLYVGFVVSLEDLFNKKDYPNTGKIFLKPFKDLGLTPKFIPAGISIIFVVALAGVFIWAWIGILISIILFFGTITLLSYHRKKRLKSFALQMQKNMKKANVLIYQLGADYVVKKAILDTLDACESSVVKEKELSGICNKFDVILVLNSIKERSIYLCELQPIKTILKDGGMIIDPFVSKNKKRNYWASWFGIPNVSANTFDLSEYFQMLGK